MIIARTDARAVSRASRRRSSGRTLYHEAGADVLFVEAPPSVDEMRIIGQKLAGPLVANMVEGGKTPLLTRRRARGAGLLGRPVRQRDAAGGARAVRLLLKELGRTGTTKALLDQMASWNERQDAVGKAEFDALELKYATEDQS